MSMVPPNVDPIWSTSVYTLTIGRDDHDLVSEGNGMQEDLAYTPAIELVPATPAKKAQKRSNKGRSGTNTTARKEAAANTFAFSRPGPLP